MTGVQTCALPISQFFAKNITLLSCDTFIAVFDALASNQAEYAVIATENSLYGTINEVYDLLKYRNFWICGEIYLRIEHCLIGLPGSSINEIQEVYSHPVALAQCRNFLENTLKNAEIFEHHDTAKSVEEVKYWNQKHKAAVASKEAAELHGMQIIQYNVEDNHQNYTRFFILQQKRFDVHKANKTSLILQTPEDAKPGALYRALKVFAKNNINLTMLHSRPVIGKAWHYMFYIDVSSG